MSLEPCAHVVEFNVYKSQHCDRRHVEYYEALASYFADLSGTQFCFSEVTIRKPTIEKNLPVAVYQPFPKRLVKPRFRGTHQSNGGAIRLKLEA